MRLGVVVLVLVLATPALAESGTSFDRRVERLVAMPTPLGPVLFARDDASWRLELPPETVVTLVARGDPTTPFQLRIAREGAAQSSVTLPTTHAGYLLSTPGVWLVAVDPLAGAAVDIRVAFRGHVADDGGAGGTFTLSDAQPRRDCVVPGVCLA